MYDYGLVDVKRNDSKGVTIEPITNDNGINIIHHLEVLGPDVAILECREPHGLPSLEIAEPVDEKSPLHIVGLTGKRYTYDISSEFVNGGAPLFVNEEEIRYVFKPAMYTQRFKCLPADEVGNYQWVNRVYLRVITDESGVDDKLVEKFFMNDQVFPRSPKGFGLIAEGDSGSSAIIVRGNQTYLAGIVSAGQIEHVFVKAQNILESIEFDFDKLKGYDGGFDFLTLYNDALEANKQATTEENQAKKLFITQSLADLTHLKPWISSVINK